MNNDTDVFVPTLTQVVEAMLLFHRGGPWTAADGRHWAFLTGTEEATTRNLCDAARAALAKVDRLSPEHHEAQRALYGFAKSSL